jgi:hypothetical protein
LTGIGSEAGRAGAGMGGWVMPAGGISEGLGLSPLGFKESLPGDFFPNFNDGFFPPLELDFLESLNFGFEFCGSVLMGHFVYN